jgi:hypothetical protein
MPKCLLEVIEARLLVDTMGYIRKNCNESFHLSEGVSFTATENETTVTKSCRQRHTANAAAKTIEEHFRKKSFQFFH